MRKKKNLKQAGELKDWHLTPYNVIIGRLYNDKQKRWKQGERIRTSLIKKITVETLNSVYTLDINSLDIGPYLESVNVKS